MSQKMRDSRMSRKMRDSRMSRPVRDFWMSRLANVSENERFANVSENERFIIWMSQLLRHWYITNIWKPIIMTLSNFERLANVSAFETFANLFPMSQKDHTGRKKNKFNFSDFIFYSWQNDLTSSALIIEIPCSCLVALMCPTSCHVPLLELYLRISSVEVPWFFPPVK